MLLLQMQHGGGNSDNRANSAQLKLKLPTGAVLGKKARIKMGDRYTQYTDTQGQI